jgi:hypothetical protein
MICVETRQADPSAYLCRKPNKEIQLGQFFDVRNSIFLQTAMGGGHNSKPIPSEGLAPQRGAGV